MNGHIDCVVVEEEKALGEASIYTIKKSVWKKKFEAMKDRDVIVEKIEKIISENGIEKFGYIDNVYVEKNERRRGKGGRLVREMVEELKILGADVIVLESDECYENEFDITEWYQNRFGFGMPLNCVGNPILYKIIK